MFYSRALRYVIKETKRAGVSLPKLLGNITRHIFDQYMEVAVEISCGVFVFEVGQKCCADNALGLGRSQRETFSLPRQSRRGE